jgi:hypothetical protein
MRGRRRLAAVSALVLAGVTVVRYAATVAGPREDPNLWW